MQFVFGPPAALARLDQLEEAMEQDENVTITVAFTPEQLQALIDAARYADPGPLAGAQALVPAKYVDAPALAGAWWSLLAQQRLAEHHGHSLGARRAPMNPGFATVCRVCGAEFAWVDVRMQLRYRESEAAGGRPVERAHPDSEEYERLWREVMSDFRERGCPALHTEHLGVTS